MYLLDISMQTSVIIGISAMVVLFSSFLIAFISNQRQKLQFHKNLQTIHEQQQQALIEQNLQLEDRVKERTEELLKQKNNLQVALSDLKASQLQLVQKEKMASLGEIASGIAHEIQNPLNFVNNFAEINAELVSEIKDLLALENDTVNNRGEMKLLIEDVNKNLQKIHQHGKRADAIVKSMLQHSRSSSGQKESTGINALTEEYLRLAYHGQKARDISFNAILRTDFDPSMGRIDIIPNDISRVLLNLFNNAFYAVTEKSKVAGVGFEPAISVSTKNLGNKIEIRIKDNGTGVPEKIKEKIFQPFFTTKPTGVGTGLGLSLSYEIIKAHQGELTVNSKDGEFTEFVIELPAI